jgi:hypothetical protein
MEHQNMDQKPQTAPNPLSKYFRQPAIYLKLPSDGEYWPEGAINLPVTGEIPIYPLTTRDEIVLKTPDALMNGAGVVEVIQSCCPNILNAWQMPSIDVDTVLIGIRIASYGHTMDFETKCPYCEAENTHGQDLRDSLASITVPDYNDVIKTDSLIIKLKPAEYFANNKSNQINFEEQKMLQAIEKVDLEPQVRNAEIQGSMQRLINIGIDNLTAVTDSITTVEGDTVGDPEFIKEFYTQADSNIVKSVQEKISKFTKEGGMDSLHVACTNCEKTYDVPMEFDYASFFGNGF